MGHSTQVNCLRVSDDGQSLVSCADDGSIFVYEFRDNSIKGKRRETQLSFAEEILVEKETLEKKNEALQALYKLVLYTKEQGEKELGEKEAENEKQISQATKQMENEQRVEEGKYLDHQAAMNDEQQKFEKTTARMLAKQKENDEELNVYYEKKLASERTRYTQLQKVFMQMQEKWKVDSSIRNEAYQKEVEDIQEENEDKNTS